MRICIVNPGVTGQQVKFRSWPNPAELARLSEPPNMTCRRLIPCLILLSLAGLTTIYMCLPNEPVALRVFVHQESEKKRM
jgi:hypothetical protein